VSIIIRRPELESFLRTKGRRLLYGRRKTGKTFMAKHILKDYHYYIVRRGGTIYDPAEDLELDTRAFLRICRLEDKIILDEFHRANPKLFDAFHAGTCSDNLVLITSTLHYFKRFVEGMDAPLQGLFKQYKVDLISPRDILVHDWGRLDKDSIILLTYYQEPLTIGWNIEDIVWSGPEIVRGLVGDILLEEDYSLTTRYIGILEAIAAGNTKLSEIASWLYSRGLIDKQETGLITKYITTMNRIGLIEKLPIWRSKRHIYRHKSPLTYTLYYLEARYNAGETPISKEFKKRVILELSPVLIELFIERLLTEVYGLRPVRILEPEIDIALVQFKKLHLLAEVKWTAEITKSELRRIEEKLSKVPAKERMLILPDKSILPRETFLSVIDINDLVRLSRSVIHN